ncbi:hypothetical protein MWU65_16090 [Cellulophaga sp. F20128]|uniref:hypothetical protein n=1 Tax=Cellulophaga sp. F20128 TaxID=2926413 RepID=UPI001FF475FC|nr:hypothetical protein [Cellulophaga sp. F20128]MCK0158713.1 hypothetical protein [Cellulophaga sp. F20128]
MKQLLYKTIVLTLMVCTNGIWAQNLVGTLGHKKQTKTFKEVFNVGDDAVLDLNTSNADIEFDTWNKDVIQVEAVIEIEGMSKEEAENYFKRNDIQILGNSKKVEVSTNGSISFKFAPNIFPVAVAPHGNSNLRIDIDNLKNTLAHRIDTLRIDSFPVISVSKSFSFPEFDYESFKEDGNRYIVKWQHEMEKNMGPENEKEISKYAEELSKNANIEMKKAMEMEKNIRKMTNASVKQLLETQQIQEAVRANLKEHTKNVHKDTRAIISGDSIFYSRPNTFYFGTDGGSKNLKIKKTIKIKMPKSATIKMNVRHGNVKLAENTKNINANLTYASLLAATIDGTETFVNASYSPVVVNNWNDGYLEANYVKNLDLNEVRGLTLSAVSSNITIDKLLKTAFIKNDFGSLIINDIATNFETLDVSVKNGELECSVPQTSYTVYIKGNASKIKVPENLTLTKTQNQRMVVYKGYSGSKNADKSVNIDASYSEVVLK